MGVYIHLNSCSIISVVSKYHRDTIQIPNPLTLLGIEQFK